MTFKNAKTIVFGAVLVAMILPFSGMPIATAEKPTEAVYDPIIAKYLEETLPKVGVTTTSFVKDGHELTETIDLKQINEKMYHLTTTTIVDGEVDNHQKFIITDNQDGTYKLVNPKLGFVQTYTTVEPAIAPLGSGSSDSSGARIDLYDSEYGLNPILEDEYSGCFGGNYGWTEVTVDGTNGYSYADWDSSWTYHHVCLVGHTFSSGEIIHEGDKHDITSSGFGEHTFSHAGGYGTYSVDVEFIYGSW